MTYLARKAIEFGEKRKRRAFTPFRVIQGHRGRYQSKPRMRLPISIVTDNPSRTVAELSQLIVQFVFATAPTVFVMLTSRSSRAWE